MRFLRRLEDFNGRRLIVAIVVAFACLFALLIFRGYAVTKTDKQLCTVIHRIVAGSAATVGTPGSPGYAYYHAHPSELRAQRAANRKTLAQLDCDHLPTAR